MRWFHAVILVVLLGTGLAAEEPKKFPYLGEVTGDRVNVRAGLGKNWPQVHVALTGERVVVLDEQFGWLKIQAPPAVDCWIAERFVKAAEGGEQGEVTGDRVNVRIKPSSEDPTAAPLGQVLRGDRVHIRELRDGWFRIAPPDRSACWIYGEFVKYVGPYDDAVKARLAAEAAQVEERVDMEQDLVAEYDEILKGIAREGGKERGKQDYAAMLKALTGILKKTKSEKLSQKVDEQIANLRPLQAAIEDYRKAVQEAVEAERRHAQDLASATAAAEKPEYAAVGMVDGFGNLLTPPPGTHKLVKGGKVTHLLRSDTLDLNRFLFRHVGLQGTTSPSGPAWDDVPVLNVTEIVLLDVVVREPTPPDEKKPQRPRPVSDSDR